MAPILASRGGVSARAYGFGSLVTPLGDFESISTVTVTSGAPTTVTFSSIPSTYKHLQIRSIAAKGGTNDWFYMTINGDTGTNYSWHLLYGQGTSAGSNNAAGQPAVLTSLGYNSTTTFGASIIDILDYTNTGKYKTIKSFVGIDNNGSGEVYLNSGNWRSTSAISSITFTASSGTGFSNGTQYALYGLKG
jgi:hypothetical protein